MTWLRLDDDFADHPKVRNRTDQAYRLFVDLCSYMGRYNTDGKLTFAEVEAHKNAEYALELVECGLWEETDYGFYVPGFLKVNPTKAKVEAERAAARERQSRRRSQTKSRRDSQGDSHGKSHDPVPTRPEGSGVGESVTTELLPPIVSAPVPDELREQNLAQVRQLRTQEAAG